MKTISLHYKNALENSDKVYNVQVEKKGSGYVVNFQYGRTGGTLQQGTKTNAPIPLDEAERIFDKLVAEKMGNGYKPIGDSVAPVAPPVLSTGVKLTGVKLTATPFPPELLEPISDEDIDTYIASDKYIMQNKENGHRRQIKISNAGITGFNKKGQAVNGIPKPVVDALNDLGIKTAFLDGELIGERYVVCDLLELNGVVMAPLPTVDRIHTAQKLIPKSKYLSVVETWEGAKAKKAALAAQHKKRREGVVFKLASGPYRPHRNGQHKKKKFWKSATCKVIGMNHKGHDSVTLALLDEHGKWREVGRSSMIGKDRRIKVGSLVEVKFLNATEDHRLYQPTILELRDDVNEKECTMAQQLKGTYIETVQEVA